MKRIVITLIGAAVLGSAALSSGANAMPLSRPAVETAPVEDVAWRQVCRPVPTGWGRFVQRCRMVHVDRWGPGWGRPGWRGPGGPPPPPRYGFGGGYGGGWRGPGYY